MKNIKLLIFIMLVLGHSVFGQSKPPAKNTTKPSNTSKNTKPTNNTANKSNTTNNKSTTNNSSNKTTNNNVVTPSGNISPQELEEYKAKARQLLSGFEYALNILGDSEATAQEKLTIVNESYLKFFDNPKVQIEDDLDEKREVVTNKDVQAYLKDVDFFFQEAVFEFNIDDITHFTNAENQLFFKVSLSRNLQGTDIKGDSVNSNKVRYVEMLVNSVKRELKIISVYTTRLNEAEEMRSWWTKMSPTWKNILGKDVAQENPTDEQLKRLLSIENLDLSNQAITDLLPLSKLTNLKRLDISNTPISDLSPIRNLNKITFLDCSKTNVSNFTPLRYALSLSELIANASQLDDLEAVANFRNLRRFQAENTKINNLSPLAELQLQELRISKTPVVELTPLANMRTLEYLKVSDTKISSLAGLENMNKLERLEFDNTNITDLSALRNATNLQLIYANKTKINTLSALEKLANLKKVHCDNTPITKKEAARFMEVNKNCLVVFESEALEAWWKNMPNAWKSVFSRYVTFSGSPNDEQLHKMVLLSEIDLSGQAISSLEPLRNMTNLTKINCAKTQVSSVSEIRELIDLQELNCSNTPLKILTPLANLPNLQEIDLQNTLVEDISALEKLSNLRLLNLDNTKTKREEVEDFVVRKGTCLVIYRSEELKTWWETLPDEWRKVLGQYVKTDSKASSEQLHKITSLDLIKFGEQDQIRNLAPLSVMVRLKELRFSETEVSDLQPISQLKNLEILECSRNPISNFSPLENLKNLKYLDCENTPLKDLMPIGKLQNLEILKLAGTPIRNLKAISGLKKLQRLEIFNTKVWLLSPIYELSNLKMLRCYNTRIWKMFVNKFRSKNPNCEVIFY